MAVIHRRVTESSWLWDISLTMFLCPTLAVLGIETLQIIREFPKDNFAYLRVQIDQSIMRLLLKYLLQEI